MRTDQKIIRNKAGLLELAKHLGNVSRACAIMGYSRESFKPAWGQVRVANELTKRHLKISWTGRLELVWGVRR